MNGRSARGHGSFSRERFQLVESANQSCHKAKAEKKSLGIEITGEKDSKWMVLPGQLSVLQRPV